jgi:hypothetical protein
VSKLAVHKVTTGLSGDYCDGGDDDDDDDKVVCHKLQKYAYINCNEAQKVKCKVYRRAGRKVLKGGVQVYLYSFFNLGVRWYGLSTPRHGLLTEGKVTRYPFYRTLARSGASSDGYRNSCFHRRLNPALIYVTRDNTPVSWRCAEDSGKRFGTSATAYKRQQCLEHAVVCGHLTFFDYRAVDFDTFAVLFKTALKKT